MLKKKITSYAVDKEHQHRRNSKFIKPTRILHRTAPPSNGNTKQHLDK